MKNYRPELILVAAGFDGHCDDPMGRTHLTEMAYQGLTELMLDLQEAGGNLPVLLALEGGYHLPSLVSSVRTVINVLSGKRSNHRTTFPPTELGAELLEKACQIHRGYHVWTD
jgi:acetoin utilization deacetylase AcuC-like enzyme